MPPRVPIATRVRAAQLFMEGKSQRAIASELNMNLCTVNRIVRAFRDHGRIEDAPHGRRPRKTTEEQDRMIVEASLRNPLLTAVEIRDSLGLDVAATLVRSRLIKAGLRCKDGCAPYRTVLLSPEEKEERLRFAQEYRSWTADEWVGQVVFTDDTTFRTRWDSRRKLNRPGLWKYQPLDIVKSQGRCFVNVWGCLTHRGLGPIFRLDDTLTCESYVDVISHVLVPYLLDDGGPFPDGCCFLQQGTSVIHRAPEVTEEVQRLGFAVLPWPTESQDFSPMAEVWRRIENNISHRELESADPDELWEVILEQWNELRAAPDTIVSIVKCIPKRLQKVAFAEGGVCKNN